MEIDNIGGGGVLAKQASKDDIVSFLSHAKELVSTGRYAFIPRRKNMQSLAQYGLTVADAKDEILDLVDTDYYKGPKKDFDLDRPGDIWEFKKDIDGTTFYIKLKIDKTDDRSILKCIGFHEDEFS